MRRPLPVPAPSGSTARPRASGLASLFGASGPTYSVSGSAPYVPLSEGLRVMCRQPALLRAWIAEDAQAAYTGVQNVTMDADGYLVFADVALGHEYAIRWRPPKEPGGMVHALSIEASVPAAPWEVVCMVWEVRRACSTASTPSHLLGCRARRPQPPCPQWDLMRMWNPFMLDPVTRFRASMSKFFFYGSAWFPFPFGNRHTHVEMALGDLLDEIGAFTLAVQYGPVPEALEATATPMPAVPAGRVLASIQPGTGALVEPVFPHEVPVKAREIYARFRDRARGAGGAEDDEGLPGATSAAELSRALTSGDKAGQGARVGRRRRRRSAGAGEEGPGMSLEELRAAYADADGRLRKDVVPSTRVRFTCYTDVRVSSPPETLVSWALAIVLPWVYKVAWRALVCRRCRRPRREPRVLLLLLPHGATHVGNTPTRPRFSQKGVSLVATIFEPSKRGSSPYRDAMESGRAFYLDVVKRRCYEHLQRRLDGVAPQKRGYAYT